MKCPKCGYLGFETSDRCRNCGYDFSLAVSVDAPAELPLRSAEDPGAPLADLHLGDRTERPRREGASALNLDQMTGGSGGAAPPPPGPPCRRIP